MDHPKENRSVRIGRLAFRALQRSMPPGWIEKALDGTDDYGLDYQVQVETPEGFVVGIFWLQLKSSTRGRTSLDGSSFAVELHSSTVNYYNNITQPILLVYADLSASEHPEDCPCYWVWAHDEIRHRQQSGRWPPVEGSSVTFRVPKQNRLHRDLDVLPHLAAQRKIAELGRQLDRQIAESDPALTAPERSSKAERALVGLVSRGKTFLDAVATVAGDYWPEAPAESVPGRLTRVDALLKAGKLADARALLDGLAAEADEFDDLQRGTLLFLRGRLLAADSDESSAIDLYRHAFELTKNQKHLAAYGEATLRRLFASSEQPDCVALLAELTAAEGDDVSGLRARIHAFESRPELVDAELARIGPRQQAIQAGLSRLIQSRFDDVIAVATTALADAQTQAENRAQLHFLRARARYYKAVGPILDPDGRMPASGQPGTDFDLLKLCWEDIGEVVRSYAASDWPTNTEVIADIWCNVALSLGYEHDVLPMMRLAARTKPRLVNLQRALELVALHADEPRIALEANQRLVDDPAAPFRRMAMLYRADQPARCLELLPMLPTQGKEADTYYPLALAIGVQAADSLRRQAEADKLLATLSARPDAAKHLALLEISRSKRRGAPIPVQVVERLFESYVAEPADASFGLQVMLMLPATDAANARRVCAVAAEVERGMLLPVDAAVHLCQALTTLDDADGLLRVATAAAQRYPLQTRFRAIRAFALDLKGHFREAQQELEQLIDQGEDDLFAIRVYADTCSRVGNLTRAIAAVEQLLARAEAREKKRAAALLLYQLVTIADPRSPRGEELAWEVGELSEPASEEGEGGFICLYMQARLLAGAEPSPERTAAFAQRSEEFFNRFPDSPIIKRRTLPENPTFPDFERLLHEVDPHLVQRRAAVENLRRLLERGTPFPFAWRPRRIFENVSNVLELWALSKAAPASRLEYRLLMVADSRPRCELAALGGRKPVMDVTSLLVVTELGLWPTVFAIFDEVFIGRDLLSYLRRLSSPFPGGVTRTIALHVLEQLEPWLDRVVSPHQPTLENDDELEASLRDSAKILATAPDRFLYCDDAANRALWQEDFGDKPSISTVDLLAIAKVGRHLTPRTVSEKLGRLCSWHVMVAVDDDDIIAAIPEGLSEVAFSQRLSILARDAAFAPIVAEMWNIQVDYPELQLRILRILRRLVTDPARRVEDIEAVASVWLTKASLHPALTKIKLQDQAAMVVATLGSTCLDGDPKVARRIWNVALKLVATAWGDIMEVAHEAAGACSIGRCAAMIDRQKASAIFSERSVGTLLGSGTTMGTPLSDAFLVGYREGITAPSRTEPSAAF